MKKLNVTTYEYKAKARYKGSDSFAIKATGQGPTASGTSVITVQRDDQIAFLAPIAWRTRVAVRQVILWQRSSQASDTRIRGDSPAVLRSGGRADLTVFGRSDDSNDDRAKQKHHEHNQPSPGRS